MTKTRVAKITQELKIELFDEELPDLKENQVLVKLLAVGICGSDLHFFRHCGLGSFKNTLPIDIGHEPSGVVVDSKSSLFAVGDSVAIEPGINCHKCKFCKKGLHNLCMNTKFLGANDIGAFRDYIILEPERLFKIENISFEKAALLEPLGVALHAINRVHCKIGEEVAVLGSGTIGLCILSVLKKMGCKVTMFDPLNYRLYFASKLGADATYINNADAKLSIKNKFSVVFDAVGSQDSMKKSVQLVATSGEICIVGIPEVDDIIINPHQMRVKEITLTNSRRSNQTLEMAYHLYHSDNQIEDIVTHRFPLEEIQTAFEIASDYLNGCVKIMILG